MSLHRRADEQFEVDPADDDETGAYMETAEAACTDLCERCGLKHPQPAARCPHANLLHLKGAP